MATGVRVVRGPDWNLGDADGGEGHVGTVVEDNGDHTVDVYWDMGQKSTCSVGKGGKHHLRILDSAPVGVKHQNVSCDNCQKQGITGMRWKCNSCDDFDLCTPCYFQDKHNLQHQFRRIDKPGDPGLVVSKRSTSSRMRAMGMFPGASVVRGLNWDYGTQDGGPGKTGLVEDVKSYGSDASDRNAVRVKWDNGERNVYRVGYRGKVDVKCTDEVPGTDYYREHLPYLSALSSGTAGEGMIRSESAKKVSAESGGAKSKTGTSQDFNTSNLGGTASSVLKVGDKVSVALPEAVLREVQRGHGGWSTSMSEAIGEIATIKSFSGEGDLNIDVNGKTWRFYAGAVVKVPEIKLGDIVRVLDDENKVKTMQRKHGGWNDDMKVGLGKVGKIVKIDSDGDIAVAFGKKAWVYSPACLTPAPGCTVDQIQEESSSGTASSGDNDGDDIANDLARFVAQLMVLETLGAMRVGPEELVTSAAKGQASAVKNILTKNKSLVNEKFKGLTALILASYEGHTDCVRVLLQFAADKEATDTKGNTALLAAIMGKEEDIALLLVKEGSNVKATNIHNRSAAHCAARDGLNNILKVVLQNGCDPNKQDIVGDTALHDAIEKQLDSAAALMLSHPRIDLKVVNEKGFNALQYAAFKGHDFAAVKIISLAPALIDIKKTADGSNALHIAAVNNHTTIGQALIQAKADINSKNEQLLTPLHLAAHQGYQQMVKLLVDSGADVTLKDKDGDTPLHVALLGRRSSGNEDLFMRMLGLTLSNSQEDNDRANIACYLIQHGADINARNNRGQTPLQVCKSDKVQNAVRMFAERNAPRTAAPRTRNVADLLSELPMPCAVCMERMSDARLLPCKHKITCKLCSVKIRRCPICEKDVHDRVDLAGNRITVENPCKVQ